MLELTRGERLLRRWPPDYEYCANKRRKARIAGYQRHHLPAPADGGILCVIPSYCQSCLGRPELSCLIGGQLFRGHF